MERAGDMMDRGYSLGYGEEEYGEQCNEMNQKELNLSHTD